MLYESELYHHGILGQKWGKKNGPPYPLNGSDHSASEKKAGWRDSLKKATSNFIATTKKDFKKTYGIKTKKDKEEESARRERQEKIKSMNEDFSKESSRVTKEKSSEWKALQDKYKNNPNSEDDAQEEVTKFLKEERSEVLNTLASKYGKEFVEKYYNVKL